MSARPVLCLLAALAASPISVLADAPAATQPGDRPTAPPRTTQARWHYWCVGGVPELLGANASALWFASGDGLIRYEVASRERRLFSHLDGLPMGSPYMVWQCDDGRAVFNCPVRLGETFVIESYLWEPTSGWSLAPGPAAPVEAEPGYTPRIQVCFDTDGTMIGIFGRTLSRWKEGAWHPLGSLPRNSLLAPAPWGYYLYDGYRHEGRLAFDMVVGKDLGRPTPLELEGKWNFGYRIYNVKGELYTLRDRRGDTRSTPDGRTHTVIERGLFHVGPGGVKAIGVGDTHGLDFRGGGPLQLNPLPQGADTLRYSVVAADGPAGEVTVPDSVRDPNRNLPMPLRDAAGTLWLGGWRLEGGNWTMLAGPGCPTGATRGWDVMDPTRFRLEVGPDGALAWRNLLPEVPANVSGFDPEGRTGWVHEIEGRTRKLRFVRFAADGTEQLLRTADRSFAHRPPVIHMPDGAWWWLDYNEHHIDSYYVRRLSPNGEVRRYSSGPSLEPMQAFRPQKTLPELVLSPQGQLWLWYADNYFARYDPQTDTFQPAEPWDEFAFQFAGRTLSMVPSADRRPSGRSLDPDFVRPTRLVNVVHHKQDGKWQPMKGPFNDAPLYGRPGFVHGDRMLVYNEGRGVLEYDAAGDRWMVLYRRVSSMEACFDPAGRRLLVCADFVLHLDGDPFDIDVEAIEQARRGKSTLAWLDDLLRRMDDPSFSVRQRATAELRQFAPGLVSQLTAIAADADQPPEIRARVREVLAGLPARPKYQTPPSLFDRMHPPLISGD